MTFLADPNLDRVLPVLDGAHTGDVYYRGENPAVGALIDFWIGGGSSADSAHITVEDQGGEYICKDFRQYCKSTGIVQQFSSPHTPQQNGISERDGRTIMAMTRCLLHETNLPLHLWGEIASTAVFLINLSQVLPVQLRRPIT